MWKHCFVHEETLGMLSNLDNIPQYWTVFSLAWRPGPCDQEVYLPDSSGEELGVRAEGLWMTARVDWKRKVTYSSPRSMCELQIVQIIENHVLKVIFFLCLNHAYKIHNKLLHFPKNSTNIITQYTYFEGKFLISRGALISFVTYTCTCMSPFVLHCNLYLNRATAKKKNNNNWKK